MISEALYSCIGDADSLITLLFLTKGERLVAPCHDGPLYQELTGKPEN